VSGSAAVFLDRDGVLNELVRDPVSGVCESPLEVEGVRLVEGAAAALELLAGAGFTLLCVSNQPAAAKGVVSVERLQEVHGRVLALLAQQGVELAGWRLCLHHPDGVVPGLAGPCCCRKPEPGMLLELALARQVDLCSSWMVGDTDADVQAGIAVGCQTLLIEHPDSAHKRHGNVRADLRARSLAEGAAQIVSERQFRRGQRPLEPAKRSR
jgi:D-glycero-D-manno-heptose 1,7-bisphosphate phosphatase